MTMTMPWNKKSANHGWTAPIEDVKQQIGQQVDHLVQVAAQISRDVAQQATQVASEAGSQTAVAARDLGGQAFKVTQEAGTQVASVARDVPSGATSLFQQVLAGAAKLAREARAIRVTREPAPAQRRPDVIPGVALLAGVGGGLALMYFFDPSEGRQRRALLRDRFSRWTRMGRQSAVVKAQVVRDRTVELAHEARKAVTSRTGMDPDMEEIASGTSSHANGTNGYGSAIDSDEQAMQNSDQPQHSEVV